MKLFNITVPCQLENCHKGNVQHLNSQGDLIMMLDMIDCKLQVLLSPHADHLGLHCCLHAL